MGWRNEELVKGLLDGNDGTEWSLELWNVVFGFEKIEKQIVGDADRMGGTQMEFLVQS